MVKSVPIANIAQLSPPSTLSVPSPVIVNGVLNPIAVCAATKLLVPTLSLSIHLS